MFLDNWFAFHLVDTATRFSAGTYLDKHGETYGRSVEGIWHGLASCWFLIYTDYPDRIRSDEGLILTSIKWKPSVESKDISMGLSVICTHSSLGNGKKLHDSLHRRFRKICHDYPSASPRTIFKVSIKAINDTKGENILLPARLVFGVVARFRTLNCDIPSLKK